MQPSKTTLFHPAITEGFTAWQSQQEPSSPEMRPQMHPVFAWLNSLDDEETFDDDDILKENEAVYEDADDSEDGGVALPAFPPSAPMKLQLRNGDLKDIHIPLQITGLVNPQGSSNESGSTDLASYVPPAMRTDAGSVQDAAVAGEQVPQPVRQPEMPGFKPAFADASTPAKTFGRAKKAKKAGKNKGKCPNGKANRGQCGFEKKSRALDQQWR